MNATSEFIQPFHLISYILKITVESEGKNASTKVRIHVLEPPTTEASTSETEPGIDSVSGSEKPEIVDDETGTEVDVEEDEAVDESSRNDNFAFSVRENVGGDHVQQQ